MEIVTVNPYERKVKWVCISIAGLLLLSIGLGMCINLLSSHPLSAEWTFFRHTPSPLFVILMFFYIVIMFDVIVFCFIVCNTVRRARTTVLLVTISSGAVLMIVIFLDRLLMDELYPLSTFQFYGLQPITWTANNATSLWLHATYTNDTILITNSTGPNYPTYDLGVFLTATKWATDPFYMIMNCTNGTTLSSGICFSTKFRLRYIPALYIAIGLFFAGFALKRIMWENKQ